MLFSSNNKFNFLLRLIEILKKEKNECLKIISKPINSKSDAMARFKKCTDKDISVLLDSSSESNFEELDESYVPKEESSDEIFSVSGSNKIFNNNKRFLLRTNALQKEQISLRLRLRRSTEQSMYKIDTDSEDEKPKRLTRSIKHHLKNSQDENLMPRKGVRIIKLPKRYSDFECYSSKSPKVSVLQRDQVNYNEKKLLLNSLGTFNTKKQETIKCVVISDDDSDCNCVNFITKTPTTKAKSKLNKQNHNYSTENINVTPKVRTRSKYTSLSVDEESKKDNVNKSPSNKYIETNATQNISLSDTPKKSRIQKNSRRTILTISNKYESIHKDENTNKTDKVKAIHKTDKSLSTKTNQRNDDTIESSTVQNGLSTPKARASLKQSALTPSMKMRTDMLVKPVTPLQEVRTWLHVSVVPKSLPCREAEFNNIYTFLEKKLMDNSGG